tara:strand:+ start:21068 stop:21301 length:234 start_codon:yes stop_codon:yes gene_type:complete
MSKIVGMDGKSPKKPQLKPEDLNDIVCEQCSGKYFRQVSAFKKVSAIMSPTGKEQIAPVPSFRCDDCDHINKEFQIL